MNMRCRSTFAPRFNWRSGLGLRQGLENDLRMLVDLHNPHRLWTEMTGGALVGQIRLAAPEDLVGSSLHPILRTFAVSYPAVEISLIAAPSAEVSRALDNGMADLGLVEEPAGCSTRYEQLRADRLVWIGVPDGTAYDRCPLPLSFAAINCAFRLAVEAALAAKGRSWTAVLDSKGTETTLAAIRADLAVGVWLESIVPAGVQVLSHASLPALPAFSIGLGMPSKLRPLPAALALAQALRGGLRERAIPGG